jgi:glycosyltransferase involved in cell wall biosynthesis
LEKLKVLMLQRIFPIYRKPIYDSLALSYNFLLLHGKNDSGIKQIETPYCQTVRAFQYSKNPTHFIFDSFSPLLKTKPKVVIHEFAVGVLSLIPMYVFCKLMRVKFILYSHGYNRTKGFYPKTVWADKYRLFLMKLADALVIYTHSDKQKLAQYIDTNKIFVAQNTLDRSQFQDIKNKLEREGKEQVKQRLGFTHKYNLIFIGRMLKEKMPEKLLDIYALLNPLMPNQIGIHFVGGGDVSELTNRIEKNSWQEAVKFYGAVYDDARTGELLFASDILVAPNYMGLSVNHAFLFNCPVVTFAENQDINHGPEIEYVVNNETGFVIPEVSIDLMAETIRQYLLNETQQVEIKKNITYKMETELTVDNMVKGFTDAVNFTLKTI